MWHFISHRGNVDGAIPEKENHPDYIMEALNQGYAAEIDVWYKDAKFYLGHNEPQYNIEPNWLVRKDLNLWIHAKTPITLRELLPLNVNTFFHDKDEVTLTSQGFLWTFPCGRLTDRSIAVLPEKCLVPWDWKDAAGVCSDYIREYKERYDQISNF